MPFQPRIGYGAIGWLRPMVEIAGELGRIGYQGLEGFGLTEMLPQDARLGEALTRLGMAFVGSYFAGSFVQPDRFAEEREQFRQTVGSVAALGGRVVVVGGGRILPGRESESWPVFIRSIEELGAMSAEAGVRLAFHPHLGTLVFTPEEIARFVSATAASGTIWLTLDTAHVAAAGGDAAAFVETYASRLAHVHLKDFNGEDFLELGDGNVPLEGVLKALAAHSYDGWLTVELDATANPVASAEKSWKHLSALLEKFRPTG